MMSLRANCKVGDNMDVDSRTRNTAATRRAQPAARWSVAWIVLGLTLFAENATFAAERPIAPRGRIEVDGMPDEAADRARGGLLAQTTPVPPPGSSGAIRRNRRRPTSGETSSIPELGADAESSAPSTEPTTATGARSAASSPDGEVEESGSSAANSPNGETDTGIDATASGAEGSDSGSAAAGSSSSEPSEGFGLSDEELSLEPSSNAAVAGQDDPATNGATGTTGAGETGGAGTDSGAGAGTGAGTGTGTDTGTGAGAGTGTGAGAGAPENGGPAAAANRIEFLPLSPAFQGERVRIIEGEIPVTEYLRFLADYTGLPVLVDTSQANNGLNTNISLVAPIENADAETVKGILEANRWTITQRTLPNGQMVLDASFGAAAQAATPTEPSPTDVIIVDPEGTASTMSSTVTPDASVRRLYADEIATIVYELRYTEPADAIDALGRLINQGGGATPAGQRGQARAGRGFGAVEIEGTMKIVVTAKFALMNYIYTLIQLIDVEVKLPERIVHIIEVEESDAESLVQIIEQFLEQRGGRSQTTRRRPTGAPAGGPAPAAAGAAAARARGEDEFETTLIAEPRTQKIIVQTYNQADLAEINMLIKELDTRFDLRRLRTRIYRMRYLKAADVAPIISEVIGIGGGGRSGQAGLGSRNRLGTRTGGAGGAANQATPNVPGAAPRVGAGGQGAVGTSLIVAHEETNSLIIQSEPEEYQEVMNILDQIDVKRRQVFLEAALVQIATSSALNFTIETLAGDPDDRAARLLFESSFGLTGINAEDFTRIFPDLSTAPNGALLAFMNRGKFPILVSALKVNTDSEVLATPFILADDNVENEINITETRFVVNTNTVNQATTTSQQGEDAGITLNLVPTISSSDAVLLDVQLEVSEFAQAAAANVLPPKTTNRIRSVVTIRDDRIYVVGGLTRQSRSKSVSKVPLLGDIPLLGKLFRSEGSAQSTTNLYIFFRAHILTAPDFRDLGQLSERAVGYLKKHHPDVEIESPQFRGFEGQNEITPEPSADAPREMRLERRRTQADPAFHRDYETDPESPLEPAPTGGLGRPLDTDRAESASRSEARSRGAEDSGVGDTPTPKDPFWKRRGLELNEKKESWFLPLEASESSAKPTTTSRAPSKKRSETRPSEDSELSTEDWLAGGR
jgi:type II secretion system protein D